MDEMKEVNILELYGTTITNMRNYINNHDLMSVIDDIKNATIPDNYKFRKDKYIWERESLKDHLLVKKTGLLLNMLKSFIYMSIV